MSRSITKQRQDQLSVSLWSRENPYNLLLGLQVHAYTLEKNLAISGKAKFHILLTQKLYSWMETLHIPWVTHKPVNSFVMIKQTERGEKIRIIKKKKKKLWSICKMQFNTIVENEGMRAIGLNSFFTSWWLQQLIGLCLSFSICKASMVTTATPWDSNLCQVLRTVSGPGRMCLLKMKRLSQRQCWAKCKVSVNYIRHNTMYRNYLKTH